MPQFQDTLQDPEEKLGASIVLKSLRAPARLIAENAGVDGDVIVEKLSGTSFETGYNAVSCAPVSCMVSIYCGRFTPQMTRQHPQAGQ